MSLLRASCHSVNVTMTKYIIEGGSKLKGEINISGNKNSVFPAVAAALLTEDEVIIKNVPNISDVKILVEILKELGVSVRVMGHNLVINTPLKIKSELPKELMVKLRGAIVLAGAVLAKTGRVKFYHPGGDIIGRRSIDTHLEGFKALGAKVILNDLSYEITNTDVNKNYEYFLEEASVTATENLILFATYGSKDITLKNCAKEPHIVTLCEMLKSMGARIEGVGSSTLHILGTRKYTGTKIDLDFDFVEFGSYAIAAAITDGEIKIKGVDLGEIENILIPFRKMGVKIVDKKDFLVVSSEGLKGIPKLHTNLWPGFPTDLMSVFIVLATQSKGVSLLHDWMFESRMFFVDKLISMGAEITIADPHRVIVSGPSKLKGREVETPDIRAGMALVLAALVAEGTTVINKAELIERGYEDIVEKLSSLGAQIQEIN